MSLKQNNPPQLLQKCAGVRKAILLRKLLTRLLIHTIAYALIKEISYTPSSDDDGITLVAF
jgi:hypothetical protein